VKLRSSTKARCIKRKVRIVSIPIKIYRARRMDLDPTWVPPRQFRIAGIKRAGPESYLDPDTHAAKKTRSGSTYWEEDISSVADFGCFGRPGSVNRRYRSGSGSFYHQAKIVRKPLLPTVL